MSPIALLRSFATDRQLRNVDFRRFWFSSALTNFGAQITLLALPICAALLLHATPAQMGTLAAFGSLPFSTFTRWAVDGKTTCMSLNVDEGVPVEGSPPM